MEKIDLQLKPIQTLHQILRYLLLGLSVITAIGIVTNYLELNAYKKFPLDAEMSDILIPQQIVSGIIALVFLGVLFTTYVVFLMWIYRMNFNLRAQTDKHMEITPGWAVGWYFVPIASLFKPYQAMREMHAVSHEGEATTDELLKWWWGFWLVSNVVGQIAIRAIPNVDVINGAMNSLRITMFSDAVDIGPDIVAFLLITKIWEAYSRNYKVT